VPYQKFSASFKTEFRQGATPKPPKPPKGVSSHENERQTLGGLGALGTWQGENKNCVPAPTTWTDAHEERAAIVEYDAGAPRAWAEGFARLDPNSPPADIPPRRWLRFIDDCGRFLDGGWARQAAAFGWGPLELFGCDRERPFARLDHAGLLWLLNGRKLAAFTAETATIETLTGAHQTYRRSSIVYGDVALPWELAPDGGKDNDGPG
jgi:hypothetical protein